IADFGVPTKLAIVHFKIDRQRDQKPVGHGVDKAWAFLDGLGLHTQARVEDPVRHSFEPFGEAEHGRERSRYNGFEPRQAAKFELHPICLIHGSYSRKAWQTTPRREL